MSQRIIGLFIIFAVFGSGCSGAASSRQLRFSGTVEMTEHNVGARVSGKLVKLLVGESDSVRKGELLGWLDRYDKAKRDYDRVSELYKQGGATRQQVEEAELTVEDQRFVSPVNGFVLVKVRETGEVVPAGGPIVDVGDAEDVWVRVYVPEGSISRVHVGQAVQVHLDGLTAVLNGRVSAVAPQGEFTPRNVQTQEERVLQSFAVKISLLEPPGSVRPGVAADVEIKE